MGIREWKIKGRGGARTHAYREGGDRKKEERDGKNWREI